MLYYTESDWLPNQIAPYQIRLHDNRLIWAPEDSDNVIRLKRSSLRDRDEKKKHLRRKDNEIVSDIDIEMDDSRAISIIVR